APIATLMNPDTCPSHLLGWLAWSFSVDIWERDWPEATKREVIREAIQIHRIKGTRGAVARSLATLGMEVKISEWFEHGGAPHTFWLEMPVSTVFDAGFRIDQALVNEVDRVIRNVKPVRAHYELRVGEGMETDAYARTGVRASLRHRTTHEALPRTVPAPVTAPLRTGLRLRQVSRIDHDILTRSAA
ncbi:MAG: phage tail protein I, partial [Rhodobacteraceae bacterium]|nr:phage tail protein I [Paracoccaceae bacterium]